MAIDKEIIKILDEFILKLSEDTRESLQSKLDERANKHGGKKVKSRLWASIKPNVAVFKGGKIVSTLTMNDYWDVVNDGRRASNVSEEGQSKIADWSATRGLAEKIRITDLEARKEKQSLSKRKGKLKSLKKMPFDRAKKAAGFLVARSLQKKDLEPTNFLDEVIEDGRIEQLKEDIATVFKKDVMIDIRKTIR
jgi:hypothetical protein